MAKPSAFILLGGLRVIVRNWTYLTELNRRDIRVLVITGESWRSETMRCMSAPDGPGSLIHDASFVSGSVEIEGTFTAAVVRQVQDWSATYDIVGVFAAGEMLVEQTGIIADALGLKSPGMKASRVCRSKYLQRLFLPDWSPRVRTIPPGDRDFHDHGVEYPAVLKPSGRRSSSGVRLVQDRHDLMRSLGDYASEEALLIEEVVDGAEYSVEALVQHGELVFGSVTAKRTTATHSPWFVELAHTVPDLGPEREELLDASRDIIEQLEFGDGIAHIELMRERSGRIVMMEIAARTPGDGILPLYHLATGTPMEAEILKIALGEQAGYPEPSRIARQVYLDHSPGQLKDVKLRWQGVEPHWIRRGALWPAVEPGKTDDEAALRLCLILKERGTQLGRLRDSDDRAVTFLLDAPSVAELDALERDVRDSLELVLSDSSWKPGEPSGAQNP